MWFGPLAYGVRDFTPTFLGKGQKQLVLGFRPHGTREVPVLLAAPNRSGLHHRFRFGLSVAPPFGFGVPHEPCRLPEPTTPSADFCVAVRSPFGSLSSEFRDTPQISPKVSSTAFAAHLPDLQPWPLMDTDFAISCPLVRPRMPRIRFLYVRPRLCSTLPSDATSRWTPLRFANPSPPSGWIGDFHPQTVEHAGHTTNALRASLLLPAPCPAAGW